MKYDPFHKGRTDFLWVQWTWPVHLLVGLKWKGCFAKEGISPHVRRYMYSAPKEGCTIFTCSPYFHFNYIAVLALRNEHCLLQLLYMRICIICKICFLFLMAVLLRPCWWPLMSIQTIHT